MCTLLGTLKKNRKLAYLRPSLPFYDMKNIQHLWKGLAAGCHSKKFGNWMFPVAKSPITECLLYMEISNHRFYISHYEKCHYGKRRDASFYSQTNQYTPHRQTPAEVDKWRLSFQSINKNRFIYAR